MLQKASKWLLSWDYFVIHTDAEVNNTAFLLKHTLSVPFQMEHGFFNFLIYLFWQKHIVAFLSGVAVVMEIVSCF